MNCDVLISTAQEKLCRINKLMDSIISQSTIESDGDVSVNKKFTAQMDRIHEIVKGLLTQLSDSA